MKNVLFLFLLVFQFCPGKFVYAKEYLNLTKFRNEFIQLIKDAESCVVAVSATFDISPSKGIKKLDKKSPEPIVEMTNFGYGVIIDQNHILANKKIVQGSLDVQVTFQNGKKERAFYIGEDEELGMCLIKIDEKIDEKFIPHSIKKNTNISAGEPVIIICNSLGIMPAVSFGNINCIREDGTLQLTTDLPAGSAGGVVFDFSGNLIGIIMMEIDIFPDELLIATDFFSNNTTLAFPMTRVLEASDKIINRAYSNTGYIGVVAADWPSQLGGAHIKQVSNGSPAQKSGLRIGDIILSMNSHKLTGAYQFFQNVKDFHPGDNINLQVLRGSDIHSINVQVEQPPPSNTSNAFAQYSERRTSQLSNSPSYSIDREFIILRMQNIEKELEILKQLVRD